MKAEKDVPQTNGTGLNCYAMLDCQTDRQQGVSSISSRIESNKMWATCLGSP